MGLLNAKCFHVGNICEANIFANSTEGVSQLTHYSLSLISPTDSGMGTVTLGSLINADPAVE